MNVLDETFDLTGWHFKPSCTRNASPAKVLRAPLLATDDEEAVTVVAEGAIWGSESIRF